MSDPTGNALRAAPEPDAREARLLALVKGWLNSASFHHREADYSKHDLERGSQIGKESTYTRCARELHALLGDSR